MDTLWIILLLGLVVVLAIPAFLWLRSGLSSAQAERRLHAAKQDALLKGKQLRDLRDRVDELSTRTYVREFSSEHVYKLLAKAVVELPDGESTYGIVALGTGEIQPFFTRDSMSGLEPEDCFGAIHGHLAKIDPSVFTAVSMPMQTDAAAEPRPAPDQPPASGHPDADPGPPVPVPVPVPVAAVNSEDSSAVEVQPTMMFSSEKDPSVVRLDPDAGLPYLKVIAGNDEGEIFFLKFGHCTIGRERTNHVPLKDKSLSRVHCEVTYTRHRFALKDNKSTNGTFCNGTRVVEHWLEFGDIVRVAGTQLQFSCEAYELRESNPQRAVDSLQLCLTRQPEFLTGIKLMILLLERDPERVAAVSSLRDKVRQLDDRVRVEANGRKASDG